MNWQQAMRAGDFARAWAISDAVLVGRDSTKRDDPTRPYHQRWVWDGRDPRGQHALVRCYHGLGDTLQFARFLPALRARAASVTVEAPALLCEILSVFSDMCSIIPFDPGHPRPPAACTMEIMELAHVLKAGDVALNHDYLRAGDERVSRFALEHGAWRADASARPSLGLCWAAGDWDSSRSIHAAQLFDALEGLDASLLSLQRGPCAASLPPAYAIRLLNPGDFSTRVIDTAELIGRLDAVVTVDGFVAHLAGAMGKPAYVLLKYDADWRWMLGNTCVWYPHAKLFRQHAPGDWRGPLAELAAAIARWCR